MVVQMDLTPYPDIEDTLIAYLEPVAELYEAELDTVVPPDGAVGIEIVRVGGTDDGITDYPRVEITAYANDRNTVKKLAESIRQALQDDVIKRFPIEFVDDDGLHQSVQIDACDTDTPPETVGYKNPERRRKPAFYRLAVRRPRTPPTTS